MPRFVVLRHEKEGGAHFDLMLENQGVLLTFSFAALPSAGASCERIFDHRLEYLDIEGELGEQKGRVGRVERGTFDLLALDDEALHVYLRGERLSGGFRLVKQAGDAWVLDAE